MIAGIFVGGASRRMGGRPKGLLPAPREPGEPQVTVVERLIALARPLCDEVVLVGRAVAYAPLGLRAIDDEPIAAGEGPLAGLAALLADARDSNVVALACDLPYVTSSMMRRLVDHEPEAAAVAPRDDGAWSPLFARYDAARLAPVARSLLGSGVRAMYALLDACGAREFPLSADERARLRDWDTPADVAAKGPGAV